MLSVGLIFTFLGWYPLVSLGAFVNSQLECPWFIFLMNSSGRKIFEPQANIHGFCCGFHMFTCNSTKNSKKKLANDWRKKNSAEFHLLVWPIRRGVEWPDLRYPISSIGLSEHISIAKKMLNPFRQIHIFLIAKKNGTPTYPVKNLAFCHQTWLAGKYELS